MLPSVVGAVEEDAAEVEDAAVVVDVAVEEIVMNARLWKWNLMRNKKTAHLQEPTAGLERPIRFQYLHKTLNHSPFNHSLFNPRQR